MLKQNFIILYLLALSFSGWLNLPVSGNQVYYLDYFISFLILLVIWPEREVFMRNPNWPPAKTWIQSISFVVLLLIFLNFIYLFQFTFDLNAFFYEPKTFPRIEGLLLRLIDLTVGIALVAITEEFVFRYKLNSWLKNRSYGYKSRQIITSILFALIHAPQGIVAIGITFIWGVFFFRIYTKSQSLAFVTVIHFLVTFYFFVSI